MSETMKPLDHLRCVVERITYQSDGYSVLKCVAKGYSDFKLLCTFLRCS